MPRSRKLLQRRCAGRAARRHPARSPTGLSRSVARAPVRDMPRRHDDHAQRRLVEQQARASNGTGQELVTSTCTGCRGRPASAAQPHQLRMPHRSDEAGAGGPPMPPSTASASTRVSPSCIRCGTVASPEGPGRAMVAGSSAAIVDQRHRRQFRRRGPAERWKSPSKAPRPRVAERQQVGAACFLGNGRESPASGAASAVFSFWRQYA